MPLQKIQFKPGINKEVTSLAGEGGWYDCDKVRFRGGFPEKIGGWAVLTYNTFLGVARSLWNSLCTGLVFRICIMSLTLAHLVGYFFTPHLAFKFL